MTIWSGASDSRSGLNKVKRSGVAVLLSSRCLPYFFNILSRSTASCNCSTGIPTTLADFSTSSLLGNTSPACNLLACSWEIRSCLLSSLIVMSSCCIPAFNISAKWLCGLAGVFFISVNHLVTVREQHGLTLVVLNPPSPCLRNRLCSGAFCTYHFWHHYLESSVVECCFGLRGINLRRQIEDMEHQLRVSMRMGMLFRSFFSARLSFSTDAQSARFETHLDFLPVESRNFDARGKVFSGFREMELHR